MGDEYDELCTFASVEYTPTWYYKKKNPGFYNVECYKILAAWNEGIGDENKKRKIECVETESEQEEG